MTQKLVFTTGIGTQEVAANRPNIGRAILGGFVGTPAMSALMYTAAPLMGVRVDIAEVLGKALGGWALGMITHMINGSLLFSAALRPNRKPLARRLSGRERVRFWRLPVVGFAIHSHAYDGSGCIQQPPGTHGFRCFVARPPSLRRAARFSCRRRRKSSSCRSSCAAGTGGTP